MTKPLHSRCSVSGVPRRTSDALALAAVALLLMVASQAAHAQTFTTVYAFAGNQDGRLPEAGLIQDSAGNLYGTTALGGARIGHSGNGTVFKVDAAGQESVLYKFVPIGDEPKAGVVEDSAGNFYGTTFQGGRSHLGIVYKLPPSGVLTVLHAFTGGTDGEYPAAAVVLDGVGNIYGVTTKGGSTTKCPTGCGTVFKVTKAGKYSILHRFSKSDGPPVDGLLWSHATGFLYGATGGTIYQMTTSGKGKILYKSSTLNPLSGLIRDAAGNLYGTAESGTGNCGSVFKLNPQGQETVLYNFAGSPDGCFSLGGLAQDGAGNFYGTTELGGAYDGGTVFKLDTAGHETVLHSFAGGSEGGNPVFGLTIDPSGNLWGTTTYGGTFGSYCFSEG